MEILNGMKAHIQDNAIHCDVCESVLKVTENDIKKYKKPKFIVCGYVGEENNKNMLSISEYYVQCPICSNKISVRNQLYDDLKKHSEDYTTYNITFCIPHATEQEIDSITDYMYRNNIKYYRVGSVKNDE